jgi:hypothetical protein
MSQQTFGLEFGKRSGGGAGKLLSARLSPQQDEMDHISWLLAGDLEFVLFC